MSAPTLVIGYGNPSRGDDALGPLLLEALAARAGPELELITDFQLQIEHVLDIEGRERVVFVDATQAGEEAFRFSPVGAQADPTPYTHALSPGALLAVYRRHFGMTPPPCMLLAIRGYSFVLGDPPTTDARRNLDAALRVLLDWLDKPSVPSVPTVPPALVAAARGD